MTEFQGFGHFDIGQLEFIWNLVLGICRERVPSSSGLGHWPLTSVTGVRIPLGPFIFFGFISVRCPQNVHLKLNLGFLGVSLFRG